MEAGVVEKVKMKPPLPAINGDKAALDRRVKSLPTAVVAPETPDAAIVQTMGIPTRAGSTPEQDKLEAVVGLPYIVNDCTPLVMGKSLIVVTIENDEVMAGVIVEKVKVRPAVIVLRVMNAAEVEET